MDSIPPEFLQQLSELFVHSFSALPEHRRHAETTLVSLASTPLFSAALLRLASSSAVDLQIRLAASIHLKNLVRSHYTSLPLDPDRSLLKSLLPSLLLTSPPKIQPQLSETLAIISSHDFPQQWPSLLPDLVTFLRSLSDYSSINGVLAAANSIFSKFRNAYSSDNQTRSDLKYCLDEFAAPLLDIFQKTAKLINDGNHAEPLFESQGLCCECFYSLNCVELPVFFEDHMREWMTLFLEYLTKTYSADVESKGVVDALRAAVCRNLQLYMEKNEEEFKGYVSGFATAVYDLLTKAVASGLSARDELIITGIKFLTTVSTSVDHAIFAPEHILQQICGSIVLPSLRLRDEDEELFEMNYIEYIRRDIEGSDIDTRRRIVCELLKGLAKNYSDKVTALVAALIQHMLHEYARNPSENWKEKDCAIYLVVSLGAKPTATGAQLVDVNTFFTSVILPELQGPDVNAFPMLKAGALKFLTVFREQIPKQAAVSLLPNVIAFLKSESNVVHSYAANCIEKLLAVKDKVQAGPNVVSVQLRYNALDIDPYLPSLIPNLSTALQLPESQENQYVMKCIMRVLKIATIGGDLAKYCIDGLASILTGVCKNPKSPLFNHYLFEAIAALVGRSCEKDPFLIVVFEAKLIPIFQMILTEDISEFWSYAFQIFAQLVDMSQPPLSENYMLLFGVLLNPESWKRTANVPALVRLLQAYLRKIPKELNNQGRLREVLGIFSSLVKSRKTEDLGFYVLNTVVENLDYAMIQPYIVDIWTTLFTLQQEKHTGKFEISLMIFMSLVLVKHGTTTLVDSINAVQSNLFLNIVQSFWVRNLRLISGPTEVKLAAVASTRLICEYPNLLDPAAAELWGKMLDSVLSLLAKPAQDAVDLDDEAQEIPENMGYSGSFARLQNAGKKEDDPLKEIKDPKAFLVTSLAQLSSVSPGRYPAVIEQFVDPSNRAFLIQLCATYKCTFL